MLLHLQLDVRIETASPKELVLDSSGLVVHSVELLKGPTGVALGALSFSWGTQHKVRDNSMQSA